MASKYFFVGRGERIVLILLAVLGLAGLGSYCLVADDAPEKPATALTSNSSVATDSLITTRDYAGPPASMRRGQTNKFAQRVTLDLNVADSLTLIRVPGIGPATAHRIIELRDRLGGYYTVLQLQEVYGVDEERYLGLRRWFAITTPPMRHPLRTLRADELPRHPYLSPAQRKAMNRLLYRHDSITSWRTLMRTGAFSRDDSVRLCHYFTE